MIFNNGSEKLYGGIINFHGKGCKLLINDSVFKNVSTEKVVGGVISLQGEFESVGM
jgi:hypothetical protein